MALDGSLMILPLRTHNRVIGAILLGREIPDGFVDQELRHDFYIIAHTTARILQIAQVRHELDERSNQLLSLQLFTKSIASIRNVEKLIDSMISSGDELVQKLKTVLPDSLSESMMLFHESNIANLKKIKELLNK